MISHRKGETVAVVKLRAAMAVVVLNKCRIVLRRLFIVGLGLTPHFTPHTRSIARQPAVALRIATSQEPWTLTWPHVFVAPLNSP